MIYKENILQYDDYYRLRKSVDWNNFSKNKLYQHLKEVYMI